MASLIWLDLCTREQETLLQEHHQAFAIIQQELAFPDAQEPQLITLIGGKVKTSLMRDLFSIKFKYGHDKIHLQLASDCAEAPSPVLIADCELHRLSCLGKSRPNPPHVEQHTIRWPTKLQPISEFLDPNAIANTVYRQLLMPFSTIVCLFADDFGGTRGVAQLLASWLVTISEPPILPASTYPRILVLLRWKDAAATFDEKLATISFMNEVRQEVDARKSGFIRTGRTRLSTSDFNSLVSQLFGDIRILPLPRSSGEIISFHPYLEKLHRRLIQESEDVQSLRRAAKLSFSAHHFGAFFSLACKHFTRTNITAFDFVEASRTFNPLPTFSNHLSNFLRLVPPEQHVTFAVPVVTSALCLDSTPPQMHLFEPSMVFKKLYSNILDNLNVVYPHRPGMLLEIQGKVKNMFCEQYMRISEGFEDSAAVHKRILLSLTPIWKNTYSRKTCLSCVGRRPENVLTCGHSFCDTCVPIHGRTDLEDPWTFRIDTCPLCKITNKILFPLKPPTAGVRGLIIDGKGFKDIEILQDIEKKLGLPISIREHFDVIMGSGLGTLLVLDLFCQDTSSLDDCAMSSELLEKEHQLHLAPIPASRFSQATTVVEEPRGSTTWNSIFKAPLASLPQLKQTFKPPPALSTTLRQIFPSQKSLFECHSGGRKIGIAVIREKDSSLCTLSNYNGSHALKGTALSWTDKQEETLWHIARAATSQKAFRGYRCRGDGEHTEMTKLLIDEQDNIWSRKGKKLDILCCLGTQVPPYGKSREDRHWVVDFRLFHDHEIDQITDKLLASLFYLELVGVPQFNAIGVFCRAQIRCRWPPSSPAYHALLGRLRSTRARFYYMYQSIPCVNRLVHDESTRGIAFSRYIEFTLPLNDDISIMLGGLTTRRRSISNCPYKLQELLEDQGLNCVFGHRDHQRRYFGLGLKYKLYV